MSKRPTIEAPYKTLAEWVADRADMRIACVCGRSMNMPAGQILEFFHGDSDVALKVIRLRCRGCGRRGHASAFSMPIPER